MRSVKIKFRSFSKSLTFFSLTVLPLCWTFSVVQNCAQDISNIEETKSVAASSTKKKVVNSVKPKEIKSKFTAISLKSNPGVPKSKSRAASKEPENSAEIPIGKNAAKADLSAAISGTVRFKQYNQAAAGVLIEAIRVDTREMIGSAETNGAGEFKLSQLPAGVDLVFLLSSSNTKPSIFRTSVGNGTKNLDFTVFPK